jgi:hypothetical protein
MAFKACRSLTLILLLSLSVVTLTVTVGISPVVAATGGGACTNGDPDSPKDTGPRPAQQLSAPLSTTASMAGVTRTRSVNDRQVVAWMMVQQLLSTLLGRPGLLR